MTMTSLVTAYAALTLAFWVQALHGLRVRGRSRRRERLFGVGERLLIAIVSLLASAAWPLLLPIKLVGWAQLAYERRGRGMWRERGPWRRQRAIAGVSR